MDENEFVTESYEDIMRKVEVYNFCNKVEKLRRSLDDALVAFEKEIENDRSNGGDFYYNRNRFCEDAKDVIEKGVEYLKYLTRKSWPIHIYGRRRTMKAYKCDRCGAYFDPPLKRITLWCCPGARDQTTDTYDVCPSCFNEVLGYLKNEKVEEMYTVRADDEPLYSCSNETTKEILKERGKEFVK